MHRVLTLASQPSIRWGGRPQLVQGGGCWKGVEAHQINEAAYALSGGGKGIGGLKNEVFILDVPQIEEKNCFNLFFEYL